MLRLAAVLTAAIVVAVPAAASDACVDCHGKASISSDREHDYSRWKHSAHSKAGVTCHDCHGGDPSQTGPNAHKGLLNSSDPSSPIYFTKVPETCGKCHADEAQAFRKSAHHKELQRSGKGPNCVTCHGSMANSVMTGQQMETTCALCHRKPMGARPALMALNNASSAVGRLEALAKASADPKAQEAYKVLESERRGLVGDWHSFRLKQTLVRAQALTKKALAAIRALTATRSKDSR